MTALLETIGWVGSILVVLSLMQARVLRFRWMNFAGALLATAYNAAIGIWPFAVMNGAITIIDVYWLWRLHREAHDSAVYAVVEVASDDAYLQHVLHVHAADIAHVQPDFVAEAPVGSPSRSAFLVVRGDETVGAVIARDAGGGEAVVELDWVSPRFRDFTPGEFVYSDSGVFRRAGFTRVVVESPPDGAQEYLRRVGFVPDAGRWVHEVPAA
ncbi:hypothetical protein GCM10025865_11810 [Paraoerskovia sediminicola]|uniref:Inner membrane protein n=1 Tax=Paraoerskovia sediminicola TaxID=1138587 RepID=A0ABM8G1C3_9CELL|nr:hypothetical protein [Paraoerskovia sediminicola]BDZ41882.1 hypothetical protein GCM10025865_11810 [Paraoerskovia sediminicola]